MSHAVRPRRSVLYMPGSNARALEKAASLPVDALILDLEDAVAPESKDLARDQVCAAVKDRRFGKREVIIRVNGLETPWGRSDMEQAAKAAPDAILVPKVSNAVDVQRASAMLGNAPASLALWLMMETPQAIFHANEIAGAGGRLTCLVMGTNDLVKELRAQHTPGREALLASLNLSVLAARAHGLAVIDGVFNEIADTAGLEFVCAQGRAMGFDGKTLIHPSQVEICNRTFSPDPEEVTRARAILAAFAKPENKGKGAIALDGRMVELLHAEIAKQTVALAEAITALERA
ncbi:MAG: CoA ester lyase [Alphaproteobacteria bacterium]|nr:CoA ester lyase [Alphaproteobacteria bacterium]